MLNLTSNERRQILGQLINVTILNPSFTDPLGGRTYADFKATAAPGDLTLLDTGYKTPVNDQASIGLAQQIGRYAFTVDFVHSKGYNEPLTPRINYFEDPATHLPLNPSVYGRPYPAYNNITLTTSQGRSRYDGLQMGLNGRLGTRLTFGGSYTLSKTLDNHNGNRGGMPNNYFNIDDDYTYSGSDQRHRFIVNAMTLLPYDVQFSAIYFAGSPRTINVVTNLDPFSLGYSGRWLDATGATLPRNSERTTSDYKLDLRLSKSVKLQRFSFQGVVDVFNVFNTHNLTGYVTNYFSRTYLQASTSTNLFYQPRQVQIGFRISY
jgi:hypothetical protein